MQVGERLEKFQSDIEDVRLMRRGPLDDEGISFQRRAPGTRATASSQEPAA